MEREKTSGEEPQSEFLQRAEETANELRALAAQDDEHRCVLLIAADRAVDGSEDLYIRRVHRGHQRLLNRAIANGMHGNGDDNGDALILGAFVEWIQLIPTERAEAIAEAIYEAARTVAEEEAPGGEAPNT